MRRLLSDSIRNSASSPARRLHSATDPRQPDLRGRKKASRSRVEDEDCATWTAKIAHRRKKAQKVELPMIGFEIGCLSSERVTEEKEKELLLSHIICDGLRQNTIRFSQ